MAGDGSSIDILLVEDNPGDVRLTREALRDGKILNTMQVVEDGVEALSYLRHLGPYSDARRPDLVLLDLNLPRMGGREVLDEIGSDPDLRSIPVVVLTVSREESDALRGHDLPASYMTKPIDLRQFVAVIQSIDKLWLSVVVVPA